MIFPLPPASGARTNSQSNAASRLRGLVCEPAIPRRPRPSRGRIIPMARPMRGRGMFDPARLATLNGVASKHGRLIKVNGHLVTRCECCDCTIGCAFPKYDPLACGPCTPRSFQTGVGGVSMCGCKYYSDPVTNPPPGPFIDTQGAVDGVYCATPGGAEPYFNPSPCVYQCLTGGTSRGFNNALGCSGAPSAVTFATVLTLDFTNISAGSGNVIATIESFAAGAPSPTDGFFFWGWTPFLGWSATHVFSNLLSDCGPWPITDTVNPPFFTQGTPVVGVLGTIVATPCCFS